MKISMKVRACMAVALVAGAALAGTQLDSGAEEALSASLGSLALEFCTPAPPEALAYDLQPAAYQASVNVPDGTPELGSMTPAHPVTKGDVVRFNVSSSRPGVLSVHGLTGAVPITEGETVTVSFRAIYSGRFPLHFHGTDRSHFEIAALRVLPKD